jgi:Zn-dependent protease with chaperone function
MGILESAVTFATDPAKMLVVVISVLISVAAILAWKKYSKPWMLYAHLLFILSPLFYFALSINCSLSLVQGLMSWCTAILAKFVIYILPPLMAAIFIAGYVLLPKLYALISKPFKSQMFERLRRATGIKAELYLIDRAKPLAFTLGNKIFVSVGMCELLSRGELEAVLLHELYHVNSRASWNKFSAGFVRLFSPIAWFSASSVEREEKAADAFAVKTQRTGKFLISAKNKVRVF